LYPQRLSQWLNAEPNRGRGQYNLRFLRPYSSLDPTRARFEAAARDLSTVRVRYREPKTAIPKEPSDYTEFVDKWTYDGTSWMMQPVEESDAPNMDTASSRFPVELVGLCKNAPFFGQVMTRSSIQRQRL